MARQGQQGRLSLSEVLVTSLMRMASSARCVFANTFRFLTCLLFSGYRGAPCAEASQVLVCWQERQIDELRGQQCALYVPVIEKYAN